MQGRRFLLALAAALGALASSGSAGAAEPSIERLSFPDVIKLAKTHNPAVFRAITDIERSEALVRQARASSLPIVQGNGAYTRLDGDRDVAGRIAQGKDSLSLNLLVQVPIVAPSRWGAWRRAEDARDVARANLPATTREVVTAAAKAYLAILFQKRAREAAIVARDVARSHLTFAERRFSGGVGTQIDVVRGAQEVATSEAQLSNATLGLARTQEALGVILGLDHPVDAAGDPSFVSAPTAADLTTRPDVRAQKALLDAAHRATNDNWREYMPLLTAQFQPFYQNPPTLTAPLTGWQAQLVLAIPFYDGGLRYGLADERAAAEHAAKSRYDSALRQARSEIRLAAIAVAQAHEILGHARKVAELARQASELARIGYEGGATSNLELVDADRRARDADLQVVIAEDNLRQAELDALTAAGQVQ